MLMLLSVGYTQPCATSTRAADAASGRSNSTKWSRAMPWYGPFANPATDWPSRVATSAVTSRPSSSRAWDTARSPRTVWTSSAGGRAAENRSSTNTSVPGAWSTTSSET